MLNSEVSLDQQIEQKEKKQEKEKISGADGRRDERWVKFTNL